MAKINQFSLPNEKGGFSQPNKSDSLGDIFMTYGIDLDNGKMAVSSQVRQLINSDDEEEFEGYAGSIGVYDTEIFAISDKAFSTNSNNPLGTWIEETTGSEPNSSNQIMDSAYFDNLFLVSEISDIKAWNGTTWSSWWQGTLGQSALTTGGIRFLWVGSDGNLYIVDALTKVYRVTPALVVTKTGGGTLDLSATQYEITCAVTNSNRSWLGTVNLNGEDAVVVEWDMSPVAATANKLHNIGAKGVSCIAIWNDTPIAILSNGRAKYFNGSSFVDFEREMRFPLREGYEFSTDTDEFIHPNGWAIIDDLPHFLVSGRINGIDSATSINEAGYYIPSGVWCLNPNIGIYHRFSIGTGLTSQEDYGKMTVKNVGALYALQRSDSKFLASYEYEDGTGATKSVLVYHDANNALPTRGYLMTAYKFGFRELWKKLEIFHKKLITNEKIKVYYRNEKKDIIGKIGTWATNTTFHITGVSLGITKGDMAFIRTGNGAGQLMRVESAEESSAITVVTFTEANTFVDVNNEGTLDFLNFRFMGEVTSTKNDYHAFTVPEQGISRKTQFLLEFQQAANNTMEVDFVSVQS